MTRTGRDARSGSVSEPAASEEDPAPSGARTVRPPLFELLLLRDALPTETPTLELLRGATLDARDTSVLQAVVEGR
ncbi:MAG: hypothetical protein QG597_1019 [Actinomycetota bacterium]|nr:hypothetical protein [Actinomycetota bacterium]